MNARQSILGQMGATAITTLSIQIVTFGVLAAAPLILPSSEFAKLSVIVAVTMLTTTFFDFGLNVTSTKFHCESGDVTPFISAFRVRLACIPTSIIVGVIAHFSNVPSAFEIGILCGAVQNLWNGIRSTDQGRQDYPSFARSCVLFSIMRLIFSVSLLVFTHSALATAIGLYVFPILAGMTSRSWPLVTRAFREPAMAASLMVRYAAFVYINSLIFAALPYLPQLLISQRLSASSVGTFGLILTFSSPISLLAYSLRSVLLPKLLAKDKNLDKALWSTRGVIVIAFICLIGCMGGLLANLALEKIYGSRFPEFSDNFPIFFGGFWITACVGLYSLSVHTMGSPQVTMLSDLTKAALLSVLLITSGRSLSSIIIITTTVMVSGEFFLVGLLIRAKKSVRPA